jgi:2-amino-4-hydroxy-6-hydroxymethyldihydropteridine diphosphokinase
MNQAVIAIGSNIDPEKNIRMAIEKIRVNLELRAESAFVTTKPIGDTDQPDFTNGALLISTYLKRPELKRWLKSVEKKLGRTISEDKNGPRTIDLDISVWNGKIVDNDVHERGYLKNAVFELLPGLK